MAKRRSATEKVDAAENGAAASKAFASAIEQMVDRGDLAGIKKAVKDLARRLDLPQEKFATVVEHARGQVDTQRSKTGGALKSAAKEAGCHFDLRPPNVEFGCVLLREENPGRWGLSILDNVAIETLSTTDGSLLGEAVLRHIDGIEKALDRVDQFAKELAESALVCRRAEAGPVPANLLMLLTSFGRSLKRELTSSTGSTSRAGVTRAEFGYLLSRLRRLAKEKDGYPQLSFSGAAQGDAAKAHQFIAVPDSDDPRQRTNRRLVSAITVSE